MNEIIFLGFFVFLASALLIALKIDKIYIYAIIAVLSVLMNVFVLKPFVLFGLPAYGGNAMYGCIFLATDLLAEHHGKKAAFKGVVVGFLSLLFYFIVSSVYLLLAPNLAVENALIVENALTIIFKPALGIVIASLTAFLISNTIDVHIYDYLHRKTGEKMLWLRNNFSTLISQFLDTVIFSLIATYFGIFDPLFLGGIILINYSLKVFVAILDTPFIYLSKKIIIKK